MVDREDRTVAGVAADREAGLGRVDWAEVVAAADLVA